ncbi:tetratricopeptide repeat protein [Algoriphagus boseongensis]|uniref:Tetratricopeptide repeat protein n=1 Tax=Algoriphagus boseongensis TaxID=1442587 RepID=A0A4R6T4X6_9BACT|nr:tetratricopeptide repeat protein [Algoriphagus boseongensis]TDQ16515.1 tetratricopeptide repeat protein [Algoriphagus boseongensis]
MKFKNQYWVILIALFGALLYLQTIPYGYSGDDGIYTYFNRVTQLGTEKWTELFQFGSMNFIEINPTNSSIYRPFTLLTFAIERQLVGEFDASVGHTINVILYFALLWVIGSFLLKLGEKRQLPGWIALLILVLYAVHPIHTEVVASVKSRDTLLSSLFAFSAILIWFSNSGKPKPIQWGIILGLYFLSLLSKEESIPLMALVFLISWFFLKNDFKKSIQVTLPFLIPFGIYMILRSIFLDPASGDSYGSLVNSVLYAASGSEWIATNFYIYLQYLKLLLIPHPLSWDYSFSQIAIQTFISPWVWLSFLVFGGLVYFAIKGFKTRSLYSFGILFYLTSFSIFANLVPSLIIGSNLGERFMFIPSLSFCFLVVFGLYDFFQKKAPNLGIKGVLGLVLFIGVLFSWKTIARSQVWESNMSLSSSGVETSPNSWRTHIMYAEELRLQGKEIEKTSVDSAKPYFEKAVFHYDQGFDILGEPNPVPQYYNTLAESLLGLGDSIRAEETLRLATTKAPKLFFGWFKLALLEYAKGNYEEAKFMYLKALEAQKPDLYSTYKNLGNTHLRLTENQEAILAFEKARKEKSDPEIERLLAYLYTDLGMLEKAAEFQIDSLGNVEETRFLLALRAGNDFFEKKDYPKAIQNYRKIEGDFEKFGGAAKYPSYFAAFGKALIENRDTLEAKKQFLKAYQVDASNHVVLTNLGIIALLKDKRYAEAERYFRAAVNANPEDPFSARMNLGTSLLIQRKEKEAIVVLEDALKYGSSPAVLNNLYLLHTATGNPERAAYYKGLMQ